MWSAGADSAQVYIGPSTVGVCGHNPLPSTAVQWLSADSPLDGWAKAATLLVSLRRRPRAVVWFSGALTRPFLLEAVPGIWRRGEVQQMASSLAADATGLQGPCEVWLDAWVPGRHSIGVAIERKLKGEMEAIASSTGVRLGGLHPWWTLGLAHALKNFGESIRFLSIEDTDCLTTFCGQGGNFTAATSHVPKPDASQRQALLARTRLGLNLTARQSGLAIMGHADEYAPQAAAELGIPFGLQLRALA